MKALLIPADFRNDQYILKPIFERLFRSLGKSSLRVEVCLEPLLGGVQEALKTERLKEIVEQYSTVDIGKRLRPGSWRDWNCRLSGIGRMFGQNSK